MATSYRERMLNSTKKEPTTNDAVSVNTSYRQRLLNSENKNNQPTQSVAGKMDSLWVESTAPNVLQKQNINATVKPVNISDFVKGVKNTAEQNKLKVEEDIAKAGYKSSDFTEDQKKQLISGNYSINPTYNPDNKFSQKIIYTGDANIKATPSLGQSVANVAEKTGRTAMDLTAAAATGVVRGYEGLADVAIGNVGNFASQVTSLGGLKPNNVSENIRKGTEKIVGYGLAGEMDKLAAEKRAEGAGSYNPNILGMGARDMVSEGARMFALSPLGMPGFIGSAAGTNIEQAINEGEKLPNATMYGNITGTIEGATEKLFDTFNVIGGGKLDKFLPKKVIAKFVLGASGEGVEEMISQAVNPFTKMLTYEQNVENPFGSWENFINYCKDVGEAGLQGFAMGMFMQGMHDISSTDIRSQYKAEVTNAVNKIKGIAENSKQAIVDGMMAGASRFKIPTNSQINEAQNQAQSQNIEQGNVTLSNQTEMAQKPNIEQMVQSPNLPTQKAQNDRLSNQYFANNKVIYNNDGTVNRIKTGENIFEDNEGKSITKTIKDYLENHINEYASIIESGQKVYLGEDLPNEYAHSKSAQNLSKSSMLAKGRAATGIKEIIENANNRNWSKNLKEKHSTDAKYGFYKYDTTFSFDYNGKERIYTGKVLIRNDANGKKYLYDILDIKPKKIDNDLPSVASNSKSSAINGGSNSSSINSIPQSENTVNTEYAQSTQNNTSAYISPTSDIQGATEFVKKATIKDVDRLRKMLEEAEKSSNRIDLQFFAEEVKKKIEYLTKSQRYQKNKVATLINKLQKTYGLDKAQVNKSVNEYIEAYNSDGDILEARDTLLNELNANGVLGEYASIEISNDIDNLNRELDTVKRYETDKAKNEEAREQNKNYYKVNKETISRLYQLKKEYQVNADKTMQKILLTKADSAQLDRLLKGEITFSELPKSVNAEQIRKAYDVRKPLVDVNKEIQNYNKAIKQMRNDKMRELTQNSAQWKDKKIGLAYARETQERNITDIAPAEEARRINKEIFEPIHHNEAEATRYKNEMRNKIKELNIDIKPKYEVTYADSEGGKTETVSESGLVQLYGEGKINDETLSRLGVDSEKIKKAVATFREIYNDLYNKTNDVLVQNGYAPVEFRKDYFPHFEETKPDTIIGKALNKLGFKMDTKELPTDIAGLTHTFRPGKKWVSNFLQRTTDVATYDAVKGFDSYLDSVADVIYHTDDIQNLRAYENALRYQHSDPVIKEQIDEVINMDIANEMKQSMIDQLYANAENSLAHYVTDLRAYTDNLAGKKSLEDRTMEHNLGRGIYNITKNVQSRVSANMVGANISSALTNFIPITQATSVIDGKNLIQATYDTVKNVLKSDGFAEQSDFLTNRRGSDKLYKTVTDKIAGATNLMSLFDNITSEVINRGRYYQNIANGMSEEDARAEADQMSGNIMADRSKGSTPTVFNQSSPVTKLLTAFQLEVNNQYSYLFKDIPNEYKDKAIGSLVWAFAKFFIGAWLYNELYEKMTGRRAALDPINIVTETIGDIKEGKKVSEVASGLATEIVEDIPFVGGLIGGGRLPISNALPDVGETVKAGISLFEEGDKKKALKTLGSELSKPVFYILPPFGGGQLKKTVEGVATFVKGGNYGVNAQGQETLKYPVEQTPGNFVKSALFGKWSTKGAVDYVDNGFKALSANQTEGYEKAKKAGITDKYFYDAYNAQKKADKLGDLTSLVKKNEIDKATRGLSQTKRQILYETFGVAKGEWDNTRIVSPYEIKAQKEKLAREKLKTKKK